MTPYEIIKRSFDVVVSAFALILLSPFLLIFAWAVKIDSPGPSIYRGLRVGQGGKTFRIYKFRSMSIHADRMGSPVTTRDDPRVTRVGQFLRRRKIDELPNLINILLGSMSFVGPRPESPDLVANYTPEQRRVLKAKPGVACLAQIRYPNEQSLLQGKDLNVTEYMYHMADKLDLDILYVDTRSFWGDLLILFFTIVVVFGIQVDLENFFRRSKSCHLSSN